MSERTTGPAETEAVGARLARSLRAGDVVLVSGEIGSGKTTFVKGAARELGVREPVVSPTFTIGRRYAGARAPVSHLDLYRLEGLEGEEPGMLDDYLTADAISFVEWPSLLERDFVPPALEEVRIATRVTMSHAGGDRRDIAVEGER